MERRSSANRSKDIQDASRDDTQIGVLFHPVDFVAGDNGLFNVSVFQPALPTYKILQIIQPEIEQRRRYRMHLRLRSRNPSGTGQRDVIEGRAFLAAL